MTRNGKRALIVVGVALGAVLVAGAMWLRGHAHYADNTYDASVARKTYTAMHPKVCIDAAHHNFATVDGRYAPFARLLGNDGYDVYGTKQPFTREALARCGILVIANAMGGSMPVLPSASSPAFTAAEIGAVRGWVSDGGSLLLVADHAPIGAASAPLARALGVDMSQGRTEDDPHSDWTSGSSSWLVFSRDTGAKIIDHAITRGRDSSEMIRRVITFTGQSLKGPDGSVGFLQLAPGAIDRLKSGETRPAAGRAQGVAFELGKGRVVVMGEAAMLTAQVTADGKRRFGMSWPNNDDRQLALNIAHWLSHDID
jgi:hypothetical protein